MKLKKEGLLVVGGGGFIGKNLIKALASKYEITSVSKTTKITGVRNINLDITTSDFKFLNDNDFKYVIYLGTVSSPKEADLKPQEAFDSNVCATQKFLEHSRNLKFKKIIFLSSAVLYSENKKAKFEENDDISPFSSIYNYSKYLLETLAEFYRRKYSMPITVFRLSNTYGEFQVTDKAPYLIPDLFRQSLVNKKVDVWNTKPIRDWVYIDDVVKVISKELRITGGGLYNLGTGKGRSVGEVAEIISSLTKIRFNDLNKQVSPPNRVICNMLKLKSRIGFIPDTSLEVGLRKTLDYCKDIYS